MTLMSFPDFAKKSLEDLPHAYYMCPGSNRHGGSHKESTESTSPLSLPRILKSLLFYTFFLLVQVSLDVSLHRGLKHGCVVLHLPFFLAVRAAWAYMQTSCRQVPFTGRPLATLGILDLNGFETLKNICRPFCWVSLFLFVSFLLILNLPSNCLCFKALQISIDSKRTRIH